MSVTAKPLINAKYALDSNFTEYTCPTNFRAIIDKFTATNTDVGAQTITVHIVPFGQPLGSGNIITSALSIAAGASIDLPEMKNHILASGDFISVVSSVASKIVIRASGREISG